jgi:hypothetical protein
MALDPESSFARFQRFDPGSILESPIDSEAEMMEGIEVTETTPSRLMVAVDFGTTFSSVAFTRLDENPSRENLHLRNVSCITRYPGDLPSAIFAWQYREEVPTELWYNLRRPLNQIELDRVNQEISQAESRRDATDAESTIESPISLSDDDSEEEDPELIEEQLRESEALFWGFGVQRHLSNIDISKDTSRRLTRFKLMLDEESRETDKIRGEITPLLDKLKRTKIIRQKEDVISDYLEQLFKHTKQRLRDLKEYNDNTHIEFVLCIPAVWPAKACLIMQTALIEAAKNSEFGALVDNSLDNLFIVSEPEAAAACILAEDSNDIEVSCSLIGPKTI